MKRLFWSLVALISLGCLAAHAEGLKKEKFSRGAWEHDIGYVQAVRVGNTLVKLAENDPRNKRIYRVGEQCHLTFAPDAVHVL